MITELDDMKSCYQLSKTMIKFERETRPQLYACIKEKQQLPWQNGRQQPAQMRSSVHFNSHDVLTAFKQSYYTVQLQA